KWLVTSMSANAILLFVVFYSFIRVALTEDNERCSLSEERKVNECLQPMLDYAAKLQADTGAVQFPLQGGEVFKKLCSIFTDFKNCVASISCDSLSVDAVDASYGYMCGAGQPLFEQHAACFARLQSSSTEAYLAEMCRAMDGYLRCSHPVILEKCGAEAWKLVSTVTRDSLGVTMPDCDMRSALI
ncbi:hypothetical protein TELCIR_17842, partial [Teladorsagia circumcincta]